MKINLAQSLIIGYWLLLAAPLVRAENGIKSAHHAKEMLSKLFFPHWRLLTQVTGDVLPLDVRGLIGVYDPDFQRITVQKTSKGAIFKYFQGFPERDLRHGLGPGWIYVGGLKDANLESQLRVLVIHDRLRGERNEILGMRRDEGKRKCQEFSQEGQIVRWQTFSEKKAILQCANIGRLSELSFLDLDYGPYNAEWVISGSGTHITDGFGGFNSDRDATVRCVSEVTREELAQFEGREDEPLRMEVEKGGL